MSSNSQPINKNLELNAQLIFDVNKVLSKFGLSEQEAILLFYKSIAETGQLPFNIPNNLTLQAMQDGDTHSNCKTFNSLNDLLDDLNNDD